jgi:PPOX class probable F420-dependent enzyme
VRRTSLDQIGDLNKMKAQTTFSALEGHRYISLTTYRKTGNPVITPVWFVEQDGKLFVWTAKDSGKAKRLRNNPCVQLGPSNHSGKLLGTVEEGMGRFVSEREHAGLKKAFQAKYGWQVMLFAFIWKIKGTEHTYVEITPP